jgi:hypothetical protein
MCRDLGMLAQEEFTHLASATDEVMRMLSALAAKLKTRNVFELKAKG